MDTYDEERVRMLHRRLKGVERKLNWFIFAAVLLFVAGVLALAAVLVW